MPLRSHLASLDRHPQFLDRVRIVIEQPWHEPRRITYDAERDAFVRTDARSLLHARDFTGAYGWIAGTGMPPGMHFDCLLLTARTPCPGDMLEGLVCGAFFRIDGDHKFVAVDPDAWDQTGPPDLSMLPPGRREELTGLYPRVEEGEGWVGRERAVGHLRSCAPSSN